ncbi:hypothetical protein OV203_47205 [Nannocystis sp. ILAH1]|uniref:hypothetical protein n=1 Tax=Nannocystis sp. ILAH1 TaxID=2996789 RepID=UPI00227062F0|nr:hypothetical protein [Nannocystis sp. ILAH1]MCY0994806.1 hypothetical protein [Nannocystis sp. ILAH1]
MPRMRPTVKKLLARHLDIHSIVYDGRVESHSVLASIDAEAYLDFVEDAYGNRGAIEGQREQLQTSSAKRIRHRMAEDVKAGAILPALVVGVRLSSKLAKSVSEESTKADILETLNSVKRAKVVSIIDGMQRTSVLRDVREHLKGRKLRVEFWFSKTIRSLHYRMLILNTGQIPWNLRRQIEVVNAALIDELNERLSETNTAIYKLDEKHRRTEAGEYQANDVIEMYIAFGLRKANVDKEAVLADQFSRLDMIEALSDKQYVEQFVAVFEHFAALDREFGRFKDPNPPRRGGGTGKFHSGRQIFDSVTACTGFMAAAAQSIFGRPGVQRTVAQHSDSLGKVQKTCDGICRRLKRMSRENLGTYLDLTTLSEVLDRGNLGTSVGEFQRAFFTEAFRILLSEGSELESMTPCWRAQ